MHINYQSIVKLQITIENVSDTSVNALIINDNLSSAFNCSIWKVLIIGVTGMQIIQGLEKLADNILTVCRPNNV